MMSKKINRILVATDFSDHGQSAVLKALSLAENSHTSLTILHVTQKGFLEKTIGNILPVVKQVLLTPEEHAALLLKTLLKNLPKHAVKISHAIISSNHPGKKILQYAKDHKHGLLVLGAHGKYSMHDWFVGTTTEYITKKTHLPVLIIKKLSKKAYRKILVPIDFSGPSKDALLLADRVFPKANLSVLHIGDHEYDNLLKQKTDVPKEKIREINDAVLFLLRKNTEDYVNNSRLKHLKPSYIIKLGYPGIVILEEAKRLNSDLVILGTEGHSAHHYLHMGRVASRVLIEIDRDVLLVPPQKH